MKTDGIFMDVYLAPLDAKQMFLFADAKEGEMCIRDRLPIYIVIHI